MGFVRNGLETVAGTNGSSVHQNGNGVAHTFSENDTGDKEVEVRLNGSSSVKSSDTAVGLKYVESLLGESSSSVNFTPPDISSAEQNTVNEQQEPAPEVPEFDVEGVLQKQETHDLYCPNCNSCITKRVILRRRKRKIQEISTGEGAISLEPAQTPPAAPDRDDDIAFEQIPQSSRVEDTVDAVTCLSCFSIFIPTRKGFLFWRAAQKPNIVVQPDQPSTEPAQDLAAVGTTNQETLAEAQIGNERGKNFPMWILTCCQPSSAAREPDHMAKPDEKIPEPESKPPQTSGVEVPGHGIEPPYGKVFPIWILECCQPSKSGKKPGLAEKPGPKVPEHEIEPPFPPSTGPPEDPKLPASQPKLPASQLPVTPDPDENIPELESKSPVTSERPDISKSPMSELPIISNDGDNIDKLLPPKPVLDVTPDGDMPVPDKSMPHIPYGERPDISKPPMSELPIISYDGDDIDKLLPPKPVLDITPDGDMPVPDKPMPHIPYGGKPITPEPQPPTQPDRGDSVTITMPVRPDESKLSVIAPDPTPPGTGALTDVGRPLLEPSVRPRRGVSGWEIIKAIVYGGLIESITSLSVISSAAAGDASTLNIVALGLANVFAGLIVLLHNLRVLRHDHTIQHYEDQLGKQGHFCLHATVAVISYLVFGLMPPIVYGFSFRESDDKNFKLITLAAASLVCILILSIGKAHVRRPPKGYIKTVLYYITIGILVSGLAYVAGMLINELLKKLGLFESSPSLTTMPAFEAGSVKQAAWSYY